jgi:RNA-directed DNA polymerase
VNGPEGEVLDWLSIDWAVCEERVRRLRQRIFKAAQDEDLKRVRNLQRLMLRSHSNTLVSVRRVTQQSSGRKTAGIDGERALTPEERARLAAEIQRSSAPWRARPVKRVYIPKSNGKQRPLGIPVIRDRVLQARVKNALEPEWEARFEPRSYGFRPGRGCQDAVQAIYMTAHGKFAKRQWVLDADLAGAFDHIDHDYLLTTIGQFPARELIRQWLTAGVMEGGRFAPTEEGTPQGGVISPLLLNVALHGMEQAAGCRLRGRDSAAAAGTPVLVRYADDFAVLCHSEAQAHQVRERLEAWLRPRGLRFNEEKTRVGHLDEGFDFLGFAIRRFGGKLIIKPSTAAQARLRERLRTEMLALRGANAEAVLRRVVPIVRGWAAFYRAVVSHEVFCRMDAYLWTLLYKWAKHSHPRKPKYWITRRYFGRFNRSRNDRWVFGDRASGAFLPKLAWTKIVRHVMVMGASSLDDPALTGYWDERRRKKAPPPLDRVSRVLLERQQGLCSLCTQAFIADAEREPDSPQEWASWFETHRKALHQHHLVRRCDGGSDELTNLRLVHAACHQQHHARNGRQATQPAPVQPSGLLEPDAGKARTSGSEGAGAAAMRPGYPTGAGSAGQTGNGLVKLPAVKQERIPVSSQGC